MSVFKNQSVKRGHSRGIMIGIILFVLAGIVIAYLLVSAATNRKINEKRAETQDYVNLRSAYAEALAKASEGTQRAVSSELAVHQKEPGWQYVDVGAAAYYQPIIVDAAEELSHLIGGKYTIEIVVDEDNTQRVVLNAVE